MGLRFIGDEVYGRYVNDVLKKDAVEAGAQIEKIILKLHNHSAQALQCLGNYCNQTLLQHHSQLIHPDLTAPYLDHIDDAIDGLQQEVRRRRGGAFIRRSRRGPCGRSAMTSSSEVGRAAEL